MLTTTPCPNCDGEGRVEGDHVGEEHETGEPIYRATTCRFCGGRGGFGARAEMAVTTGRDEAAE